MEIVLTHNNMDFDSLAAQFAVTKLKPGARMLPGYPLVGNVREFLSLYRDTLPISQLKYLDLNQIDHAYIVDCQHVDRLDETARKLLKERKPPISYTIFDHHPQDPHGLGPGGREDSIVKLVGSTTTVLVNEIRKKKIPLTAFEATLLIIGIYEDTGCLTYSGTTSMDAACVAYLLECGADLRRANDYLHTKLSDPQVKLLETLIQNGRSFMIAGARVVISRCSLPLYQEGLATLTRKLLEVESADAAVSVVSMRDRIHLVGRSDTQNIDIRELMRNFGGDGHTGAGSAVVRSKDVEAIVSQVVEFLTAQAKPEITAGEIMASPVRTIRQRTSMEEAYRLMLRYGLDGLVVTDGKDPVGVVSRRDIDQAMHHKLGHAPVQGFMSKPVITISPGTPLSAIQQMMVTEDIGRLPVLDNEQHLVGIVGRQEVLKTLYGQGAATESVADWPAAKQVQYREKLDVLDLSTRWLFEQIGIIAAQKNMVAYSVGGCVRDLFLGLPNFDLDFVVEGSAIELAAFLEAAYPARLQVVAKHERFQTATLVYRGARTMEVDLSTARTEFYEFPAALPTVEASHLEQDLYRRDFTVNALAVCLNPGQFGDVFDYFGGLSDLDAKLVRILHPFSFIEDPTRIVRAARFAARFGFKLEAKTRQQAERAIGMGIFDDLGGVRLKTELKLILESKFRLKGLDLLAELGGGLKYLDRELKWSPALKQRLSLAERMLTRYKVDESWIVYLGLLLSELAAARQNKVMDRLQLGNDHVLEIVRGLSLPAQFGELKGHLSRSRIYQLLSGNSERSLAIAACLAVPGTPVRRMIKLYLEELKDAETELTGSELMRMGFKQGPVLGEVLGKLLEAKLDGSLENLKDEISFVKQNFPSHFTTISQ